MLEKEITFEFEHEGNKITAKVIDVEGKNRKIKLPVDTTLIVWNKNKNDARKRRFSCFDYSTVETNVNCFGSGTDSFTSSYKINSKIYELTTWEHAETAEELLPDGTPKFTYWSGGECPVSWWLEVEVVRRDGGREVKKALNLYWWHDGDGNRLDIIAYRILGGQKIL